MRVTVSPKYQVVIPRSVRETLGIKAGMEVQVFACDGRIEYIPERPIQEMRGFLTGMSTEIEREEDRL